MEQLSLTGPPSPLRPAPADPDPAPAAVQLGLEVDVPVVKHSPAWQGEVTQPTL